MKLSEQMRSQPAAMADLQITDRLKRKLSNLSSYAEIHVIRVMLIT